jgi:hypothetical protein
MANVTRYPLTIEGHLDDGLGRWRWLVKWILAIPHFVALVFLWLAFVLLTIVAGVSIAVTGHYPRAIFDFNAGVLRWTWRVQFYAFTLGTDRYPPFSLGVDAHYPAQLDVVYPERLSRGLVWVKWWLLAIPHYLIVAVINGGAGVHIGLAGLLCLVAGASLAVNRTYPPAIFSFVMGLHRWAWRVTAYAALMTDEYPPFRLDPGPDEPSDGPDAQLPMAAA